MDRVVVGCGDDAPFVERVSGSDEADLVAADRDRSNLAACFLEDLDRVLLRDKHLWFASGKRNRLRACLVEAIQHLTAGDVPQLHRVAILRKDLVPGLRNRNAPRIAGSERSDQSSRRRVPFLQYTANKKMVAVGRERDGLNGLR